MKRTHALVVVLLAIPLLAAHAIIPAKAPAANAVAHQVMDALGGKARWDAMPGLQWTFRAVRHDSVKALRRHAWEKATGRHRVEGSLPDGRRFTIVGTLGDSLHGAAWLDGRALHGDSLKTMLRQGYAMWVNDSYWFLMPYKLLDPGAHLVADGTTTDHGTRYDVLSLTFDHVGLTPGDHYWVYVNAATHRVERWTMVLQGRQPPPVAYTWEGWEQHDGLWFPTKHHGDQLDVYTDDVKTVKQFPPRTFDAR